MDHHFNVEVAKTYGVPEAIFIHHIRFWTLQNLANRRNIRLGFCWTYNSIEAFTELFPYWNKRQIEHLINKVIEAGAISKTNLNIKKYDRTCWYALTAQIFPLYSELSTPTYVDLLIDSHEKDKNEVDETGTLLISLISQKCEMDFTQLRNGFPKNVTPIPDNNPCNNQKIKSSCDKAVKEKHKVVNNRDGWKETNQLKHSFAKDMEPPTADVTRQSNSYDPEKYADKPKRDPNAPGYQAYLKSKRKKQTAKLPTGTPLQPEIPRREHASDEGSPEPSNWHDDLSSQVRSAHRVMEASSAHSYLEKIGLARENAFDGHVRD